ncbi:MAG: hypothetical protein EXR72_17195 [Myxococcales bacterium]|nr:hypothetical protein [Myxococcales bacterium]
MGRRAHLLVCVSVLLAACSWDPRLWHRGVDAGTEAAPFDWGTPDPNPRPEDVQSYVWGSGMGLLATRARPSFKQTYFVWFDPTGLDRPVENLGVVTDRFPRDVEFVGAFPTPGNNPRVDGLARWEAGPVREPQWIELTVNLGRSLRLGERVRFGVAFDVRTGGAVRSQRFKVETLVVNSQDPNDLLVSPEGDLRGDERLTYVIRYENYGNAEAIDIAVSDPLGPLFDAGTITRISHGGHWDGATRTLAWQLAEINLPPKGTGYVTFQVKLAPGLAPGTVIENQASIVFDSNPAIATPIVRSRIALPPSPPQ